MDNKFGKSGSVTYSKDKLIVVEKLIEKNPLAVKMYFFLSRYADNKNVIVVSDAVLEEVVSRTRSRVALAIKTLKENGLITVTNSGKTKVIVLNEKILLRKKFDEDYDTIQVLKGTILLASKEQIS